MSALGNLVVSLALDTAAFTKGVDKSSYEAQKFAQDLDRTLNRSLNTAKENFIGFGSAALGAIGVVTSVTEAISKLNDTFVRMDDLLKNSQRFGVTVEELSKLQFSAQMSGVEIDQLGGALKELLKNSAAASAGSKEQKQIFDALGVSVTGLDGRVKTASQLLEQLAGRFSALPDGAEKSSAALALFGKNGLAMIPMLNAGEEGIRKMNDEAERFGLVVSTEAAQAAEIYNDNLSRLTAQVDGLFISVGSSLLPALNEATAAFLAAKNEAGGFLAALEALKSFSFNQIFNPATLRERQVELQQEVNRLEAAQRRGGLNSGFLIEAVDRALPTGFLENFGINLIQTTEDLTAARAELALVTGQLNAIEKKNQDGMNNTVATQGKLTAQQEEYLKRLREILGASGVLSDQARQKLNNLNSAIGDQIQKFKEQLGMVDKQTASEKLRASALDLMKGKIDGVTKSQLDKLESLEKLLPVYQEEIKLNKARAALAEQLTSGAVKEARAGADTAAERSKQLENEIARLGLKADAIAELEGRTLALRAAELRQQATALGGPQSGDVAEELLREATELERQISLVKEKAGKETAIKAAEETKKRFESITGDIAQAITNGIADGSIKGQDFIKRLFKTTVIRVGIEPFIKGTVATLFGSFGFGSVANVAASEAGGGAVSAVSQASGLGNLVSGVKSVYDVVSNGFTSLTTGFSQLYVKTAEFFGNTSAQTYANAGYFGQVAGGAAVAYGGYQLGRGISNGYSLNGGTGNGTVNTGAALGAIAGGILGAGSPLAIGIGSAIGSAIGGAVNRLFGRKRINGASGIEGNFDQFGLSNARGFQDVTLKGGLFRSSKSFTEYFGIDAKAIEAVNQAFLDVRQSVELASNALSADFAAGLEKLNLSGRLGGDLQAVLSNASDSLVREIIKATTSINTDFLEFLEGVKQESEKLADVFVRVSRNVSTANRAMLLLGQTAQFAITNAETAVGLITTLGDNGLALLDQFSQSFVPVQDQFERQVALFEQTVRELGLDTKVSINTNRTEFANLVQSIDLTTAAGQRELALLLQIMPQLSNLITKREQEIGLTKQLSKSIEDSIFVIEKDFANLLNTIQKRTNGVSTNSFRSAISSIQIAMDSVDAQPFKDFARDVSSAVPTDVAYKKFVKEITDAKPDLLNYEDFIDDISGFTPNLAAYEAFIAAVSGKRPTVTAYSNFADAVGKIRPSAQSYRDFATTVAAIRPSNKNYSDFISAVTGFKPGDKNYSDFIDAVTGLKPGDKNYSDFIKDVADAKPVDAAYFDFVAAVTAAAPDKTNFNDFIAAVQAKADSVKTTEINNAIDALNTQINALKDDVVLVDFSGVTTDVKALNTQIASLDTQLASTPDITARLTLESDLKTAIEKRYQLEQQMLGGVFATIQELMGNLKNERVAVREAAIGILGGPRVLSPTDIRGKITALNNLTSLPSTESLDAAVLAENTAAANLARAKTLERDVADKSAALTAAVGSLTAEQARITALNNTPLKIASADIDFRDHAGFHYYNRVDAAVSELQGELGAIANVYGIKVNGGGGGHNIGAGFGLSNTDSNLYKTAILKNGRQIGGFQNEQAINKHRNETLFGGEQGAGIYEFAVFQLRQFQTVAQSFVDAKTTAERELEAANDALSVFGNVAAKTAELTTAQNARAEAEQDFAEQIQEFVIDAGKATEKLGKLREETVRYYQEQQRLAQVMMASSQGLRQTVSDIRFNDLSAPDQLARLQAEFDAVVSRAELATGDSLASLGTDLNSLINPILQKASEVFASGSQFQNIKTAILADAETIAERIESLTPVNYQRESLDLLDTIDTTLGLIEANTKSAEQLIVDAIRVSGERTVDALSEIYRGITGEEIPAFAAGGIHTGGIRLVGERGPELEVTGPSKIIPNNQLAAMMRPQVNDNREVVAELRQSNKLMQAQIRLLQATAQQNAADNAEMKQEMLMLRKTVRMESN